MFDTYIVLNYGGLMPTGYGKHTEYYKCITEFLGKEMVATQFREKDSESQFTNLILIKIYEQLSVMGDNLSTVQALLNNLVQLSAPQNKPVVPPPINIPKATTKVS